MGGVVAILAALAKPQLITHLVLSVTSGGIELSPQLSRLQMPALLLWGDADPISPVRVGERLASLLPRAALKVFADAGHDLGQMHADEVAALIDRHLAREA